MKKIPNHFARGRYCTICQQVWELDRTIGREIKYPDMPSFGLDVLFLNPVTDITSPNTHPTISNNIISLRIIGG